MYLGFILPFQMIHAQNKFSEQCLSLGNGYELRYSRDGNGALPGGKMLFCVNPSGTIIKSGYFG